MNLEKGTIMNEKFSYAIKFLKIQYWKLEEQILKLMTNNPDDESYGYIHKTVNALRNCQNELEEAIKILKENE